MTTLEERVQAMAVYARLQSPDLTDYTPGSIARSLHEAIALELEQIEWRAQDQLSSSLAEAAYKIFAFERLSPIAAQGNVTITAATTITTTIPIPAGTRFGVAGTSKIYATRVAASFPPGAGGSTITVAAYALTQGAAANTAAGTITQWLTNVQASLTVRNATAFYNGKDVESDDDRLARFRTYVNSLHRGTADAINYGVKQAVVKDANGVVIEAVVDAFTVDGSAGTCTVYYANTAGTVPSADLATAVATQAALYKAAGITCTKTKATLTTQTVSVTLVLLAGYSLAMVTASVQAAITAYFASLKIGETLYRSRIALAALSVPGVLDCLVGTPSGNVTAASSVRLVLTGSITVA